MHFVPLAAAFPRQITADPTVDAEPAAMPELKHWLYITPELEPNQSDQVQKPATSTVMDGILVEHKGME